MFDLDDMHCVYGLFDPITKELRYKEYQMLISVSLVLEKV